MNSCPRTSGYPTSESVLVSTCTRLPLSWKVMRIDWLITGIILPRNLRSSRTTKLKSCCLLALFVPFDTKCWPVFSHALINPALLPPAAFFDSLSASDYHLSSRMPPFLPHSRKICSSAIPTEDYSGDCSWSGQCYYCRGNGCSICK